MHEHENRFLNLIHPKKCLPTCITCYFYLIQKLFRLTEVYAAMFKINREISCSLPAYRNQGCTNLGKPRSSRPEVFCKKGVLRIFAKFIEKHRFQSLFFNKVAGNKY